MRTLTPGQQKFLNLINQLHFQTTSGNVQWKADTGNLTSFTLTTKNGSVNLNSIDDDGQEPFEAILLNPDGIAIERLQSEWEPGAVGTNRPPASWNNALANLFEAARSRTVNLDGVITGILDEVQNPTPDFPPAADDDIPF